MNGDEEQIFQESLAGCTTKSYCIIVQKIQCSLLLRGVELSMQIAADQRSARFLPAIYIHHSKNERI